ncbi:hypothetical protein QCA50_003853 [Cerrena zonata]|uniref:CCHC-type domain-containing protein n=1 Tax=Cerrena zonata TaxID=2478898 RepID=A0AAW0GFH5_9APHY
MTRITNLGRKRTHVQAGFETHDVQVDETTTQELQVDDNVEGSSPSATAETPKKKRKRIRRKKPKDSEDNRSTEPSTRPEGDPETANGEGTTEPPVTARKTSNGKKQKEKRAKDAAARKAASEWRRLKRQDDRHADTICFACRKSGHPAKYCPESIGEDSGRSSKTSGANAVGICYRCGSKRHTLSRCRSTIDPENPLPFASCFVCSGKGHLASACPQNQSKGVYPNGGNCKLCGETTHLAKNCEMRKKDTVATSALFGTGKEAGADEDDFHTFKRRTAEVTRDEKVEERLKKMQNVKVGAHSGIVKGFGAVPASKSTKVVTF